MTPEAQRIAIAEACGWKRANPPNDLPWGASAPPLEWWYIHQLPNYLSDLNAMREAEKLVENNDEYLLHLLRIVETARSYDWKQMLGVDGCRCCAFATAAQRAEAFLRTLNLWQD